MLYISSRSKTDSFTAHRALHNETAPDGGVFVPFHLPVLDADFMQQLRGQSFCKTVSDILNLFFSCGISEWDVECSIGRTPVRVLEMSHRLLAAEMWHNPEGNYQHIEKNIFNKLTGGAGEPTKWAKIAIRVAFLFGIYGSVLDERIESFDTSVACGDFTQPMAAWYARKMGLPIGTIICACNENSGPWDLICRGELNTGASTVKTQVPLLDDACPIGLERIVFETLGQDAVKELAEKCAKKSTFRVDAESLPLLNEGLTSAVVGDSRIGSILSSVYRTNRYIADHYAAIPYGAIQDYRARSGESKLTLFFADNSPVLQADKIASLIGLSSKELIAAIHSIKE